MKKRGMTHVEMILSFIIFVTAVGFALYFFSPTKTSKLVDTSLEYVEREITENTSVILKIYSIIVNNTNGQIMGNLTLEINDTCGNINNVIVAENVSGDILKTGVVNNGNNKCSAGTNKIIIENEWKDRDFIYLKASEGIKQDNITLGNAVENDIYYQISTTDVKKLISEKRLLELNASYYNDYVALKKEFNLPGRVNFGFGIVFSDKEINAKRFIPSGLEIFSKIKRIEVLRENGKVEYVDMTLRVW